MKQTKLNLGLTLVSLLAVSVLAVAPASAERGPDDGGSGGTSAAVESEPGSGSTSDDVPVSDSHDGTEVESERGSKVRHKTPAGSPEQLRDRAEQLLLSARHKRGPGKSLADRQKACQARAANINRKIVNFSRHALEHQARLDGTFTKLQAFQTEQQLAVTEYDQLVAAAKDKQSAAKAAVDALKTVSVDIDCTSADPAASVATVRSGVDNARTALHDYHTAVKNLLVALMTAKGSDDSTNGGTEAR